jgi:general secretion pathway protein E
MIKAWTQSYSSMPGTVRERSNVPLIGQILVQQTSLTDSQLAEALSQQGQQTPPNKRIGQILVEAGHVSEFEVSKALAQQWGLPYLDKVPAEGIEKEVLQEMPLEFLKKHGILPFGNGEGVLGIAVTDPFDVMAIDSLINILGCPCTKVLCTRSIVEEGLSHYYYRNGDTTSQTLVELKGDQRLQSLASESGTEDLLDVASGAPVIRLVNTFFFQATQARASDIHVEPYEHDVKVRFRIDGVLHTQSTFPKQYFPVVASRLKIMAKLNIAERRLPQDGRSRIKIGEKEIDIRVSTVPTSWGERVVLRLLDDAGAHFSLGQIGFEPESEKQFHRLIHKSHGIILLTGPTGSGKTTTLYGAISELNSDARNIMTVEDPIEYRLPGVSQTQVMPKIGLTFAACLRHILRQDPDVIMVGEIRDLETARIAIQASLTGHLVLSTLHTNDSASAVTRLTDMGVEPYLVCSSVLGIMAQRLVRLICPKCKIPDSSSGEQRLLAEGSESAAGGAISSFKGVGCSYCSGTGYRGRTGIFELMILDDELRELILTETRLHRIKQAAVRKNMRTLREDGMKKVSHGDTTIQEVLRVTQDDADQDY